MLELRTGCRLHFGLMELAAEQPHRFGGLGLILAAPELRVAIGPSASAFTERTMPTELRQRVQQTLARAQHILRRELPAGWALDVLEHTPLHSGLGAGTQLAAAVATATQLALATQLASGNDASAATNSERSTHAEQWQPAVCASEGGQLENIRELARLSGRGKRSAIGLHGFLYGGLIEDLGYDLSGLPPLADTLATDQESNAPAARPVATRSIEFPGAWPIVLILSTQSGDMHGATEDQIITAAGAHPNPNRQAMLELSEACMTAATNHDFDRFVMSLEEYMKLAAQLFEPVQAGQYRDAVVASRVAAAERAGLRGIGQSSWGPTVFGFADDRATAERAVAALRAELKGQSARVVMTQAANHGAQWRSFFASGVHDAR